MVIKQGLRYLLKCSFLGGKFYFVASIYVLVDDFLQLKHYWHVIFSVFRTKYLGSAKNGSLQSPSSLNGKRSMPFHSPPSFSPQPPLAFLPLPPPQLCNGQRRGNMGTYGTIPTEPVPLPNLHYTSRARERIAAGLGTQRPWMEMIQPQDLSFPPSFMQLINRIKNNAEYFRANYILIILFILFLSLLWQPISLVVFIISFLAWLYLYFLHDEPWVVRGSIVDDRMVMVVLMLITVALLLITDATKNIIISMFVGVMIVFAHGALKGSEDVFSLDEEGISERGGGRGVIRMPLKHAASSSFSLS